MENTFKEKLSEILFNKTIEGKNLEILNNHFGKENINRLPQVHFVFKIGQNSWDGTNYRSINLKSGRVKEWCSVAEYEANPPTITEDDLKRLEFAILELLQPQVSEGKK